MQTLQLNNNKNYKQMVKKLKENRHIQQEHDSQQYSRMIEPS